MVQLLLYSPKGNQGVRYFPYNGYLGLTPIKIEGMVRTRLDDDGKPLPAKSITVAVRCYESRLGRVSSISSNILVEHTQVLWSKPPDREYADIGDSEFPFRITIPANVAGFSTATFQDYRIFWRVEAVLSHVRIAGVGSRLVKHFELPLIRYDTPQLSPPPTPSFDLECQTSKPRAPVIQYHITTPTSPVGPLDLVSVPVYLHPIDPAVSIRSASLIVERRLQFNDSQLSSTDSPTSSSGSHSPVHISPPSAHHDTASNSMYSNGQYLVPYPAPPSRTPSPSPSSSFVADSDSRPLLPNLQPPSATGSVSSSMDLPTKVVISSVAAAESSGRFTRGQNGIWTKTLTLQWPAVKSNSRWAMGETMQTSIASVKFFIRIKIIVSSPMGTETIDLSHQELIVVSTNDADRKLAISKYNEQQRSRSKSKSPRRSRRDREHELEQLPSPPRSPPIPILAARPISRSAAPSHSPTSYRPPPSYEYKPPSRYPTTPKKSSMKRPHTSAGPRDKMFSFGMSNGYTHPDQDEEEEDYSHRFMARPDTAVDRTRTNGPGQRWLVAPSLHWSPNSSRSSTGTTEPQSIHGHGKELSHETAVDQVEIRAWEEELARIEMQSRRSSAEMLGFAYKRKRSDQQDERVR